MTWRRIRAIKVYFDLIPISNFISLIIKMVSSVPFLARVINAEYSAGRYSCMYFPRGVFFLSLTGPKQLRYKSDSSLRSSSLKETKRKEEH